MTTPDPRLEIRSLVTWFQVPSSTGDLEHRRKRRRRASVIGHVVRVCGLLLGGVVFYVSLPVIILYASAHRGVVVDLLPSEVVVGIVALPVLLVLVGTFLVSGRKRTILFLRRFGDREVSEHIRGSLEGLLHRHYRLVALDDSTLPAIGVVQQRFRRTVVLFGAALLCLLLAVGTIYYWIRGGGQNANLIAQWMAVAALVMLVPMGGVVLLILPSVFFMRGKVRRASHVLVENEKNLTSAAGRVRGQRRWLSSLSLSAPQALILNTSDTLWTSTVLSLLPIVDVVIVDVSEPTENIEWEIAQVFEQCAEKCVVIGRREALQSHLERPQTEAATRIFERVRGAMLLTYENNGRPDPQALLNALDAAGTRRESLVER